MNRRSLLAAAGAAVSGCATLRAPPADVIVSKTGGGAVETLSEAFEFARVHGGRRFVIHVAAGEYVEKLTLATPNVTIRGEGAASIVRYDAAAGLRRPDGGVWGTSGSAVLTINAPGAVLDNLTIRNGFDYVSAVRRPDVSGAQAVALAVGRGADRTAIRRCAIEGYQDTLLLQARSYLEACRVSGCVDYIFGGAAAFIERCEIVNRAVPGVRDAFIAAPSTPQSQRHGLVFSRCTITREPGVPDGSVHLGRPWRAGGNMDLLGAAAFIECWMDAHIAEDGWTSMGYRNPAGERRELTPQEARLVEYASTGPGAGAPSPARRMLDAEAAAAFAKASVLDGWVPAL